MEEKRQKKEEKIRILKKAYVVCLVLMKEQLSQTMQLPQTTQLPQEPFFMQS